MAASSTGALPQRLHGGQRPAPHGCQRAANQRAAVQGHARQGLARRDHGPVGLHEAELAQGGTILVGRGGGCGGGCGDQQRRGGQAGRGPGHRRGHWRGHRRGWPGRACGRPHSWRIGGHGVHRALRALHRRRQRHQGVGLGPGCHFGRQHGPGGQRAGRSSAGARQGRRQGRPGRAGDDQRHAAVLGLDLGLGGAELIGLRAGQDQVALGLALRVLPARRQDAGIPAVQHQHRGQIGLAEARQAAPLQQGIKADAPQRRQHRVGRGRPLVIDRPDHRLHRCGHPQVAHQPGQGLGQRIGRRRRHRRQRGPPRLGL